ncbi:response regulator transcription factor [Paenibacillus sp. UMB4589-SE434]|uniref:response regulator n=1 Tax=Paenibacillus sp. UMB4589-SE434 TaxID=3046314 RepID=UPI00254B6A9D|nr:response regulator transcription factor [Paenibacillus sp. UMB4589-SE434]MDK8181943.1 response regulator transcription factor [Paenibacillus sp. UMB4589-SE434]
MNKSIRLVICDDDIFIRESLKLIINLQPDIEVIGTCSNGREAADLAAATAVDLILMDMRMPEYDGVEGTRLVKCGSPSTRVLILTTFDDEQYIIDALRYGANGYLLKNSPPERLIDSIRSVHAGNVLMDPAIALKLTQLLQTPKQQEAAMHTSGAASLRPNWSSFDLTPSEQAVIKHIADGMTNKEVASALFLSEGTIKNYVTDILSKLSLRDRTQLAIWYWKQRDHA